MKLKLSLALAGLILLSLGNPAQGQVTVGLGEHPVKGALLQLKDKENVTDSTANATKGLALPRVTLSEKKELYPMFLKDPSNPASGPTDDYAQNKAEMDKRHTGLIVYNLVESAEKDLCLGLCQWDGTQWSCFQQKPEVAAFEVDCQSVSLMGDYGDGVPLNTSNYLKMSVKVTNTGAYSISATSDPDNGYFFETTGTFYSTGTFSITIPGVGQPKNHTQGSSILDESDDKPDTFTITSTGGKKEDPCSFKVNVRSTAVRAEFTMDCSATVVEGMYFEDQPLSSTPENNGKANQIIVTLKNIPPSSYGTVARLETNTVDGISFRGETVLSSATQKITLAGTGIPRNLNDKVLTITSNSELTYESCEATVHMLIPHKRLMTLGCIDAFYSYNPGVVDTRTSPNNVNTLLTDKDNYGSNQWSIVKFQGFNNKGTTSLANFISYSEPNKWKDDGRDIVALNEVSWGNMKAETLESFLKGTNGHTKVDIFMIGYNTEYCDGVEDKARCKKLIEFVKAGGILMICSQQKLSNGIFMNMFFDNPTPEIGSAEAGPAGSNYTLGFDSDNAPASMKPYYCKDDDPILRGPFEDIVGRCWGEDASTTMYVTNLPLEQVVIYSGARYIGYTGNTIKADGVTIFRHRDYPFVFIGDGGFNSAEQRTYQSASSTVCPFTLTEKTIKGRTYKNYPNVRINLGFTGSRTYNTAFTANAFAWCIMKAEEIRRNNK